MLYRALEFIIAVTYVMLWIGYEVCAAGAQIFQSAARRLLR
jgi:hypothetical protein